MNNIVKFFHRPKHTFPYTCAFYEENGKIYFAVARCHTNDNFNKRLGRRIASSRLQCNRPIVNFRASTTLGSLNEYNGKINMHSIIEYIDECVTLNACHVEPLIDAVDVLS